MPVFCLKKATVGSECPLGVLWEDLGLVPSRHHPSHLFQSSSSPSSLLRWNPTNTSEEDVPCLSLSSRRPFPTSAHPAERLSSSVSSSGQRTPRPATPAPVKLQ